MKESFWLKRREARGASHTQGQSFLGLKIKFGSVERFSVYEHVLGSEKIYIFHYMHFIVQITIRFHCRGVLL
jgi:hypothetical protein